MSDNVLTGITALGTTAATGFQLPFNIQHAVVSTCTSAAFGLTLGANAGASLKLEPWTYEVTNNGVSTLTVFFPTDVPTLVNGAASCAIPAGSSARFGFTTSAVGNVRSVVPSAVQVVPAVTMTATANGVQPTGAAIIPNTQYFSKVTTAANAVANLPDGVAIPAAPNLFSPYIVNNGTANIISVWPGDGVAASLINNYAANTPTFLAPGASASFVAISNAAGVITWLLYGYVGADPIFPITATPLVLGINHLSCKRYLVNVATGTYTLPAVASSKGAYLSFVLGATGAGTLQIINAAAATPIAGAAFGGPNAGVVSRQSAGTLSVRFSTTCALGDRIDLICDGTNWHATGWSSNNVAASSIIFA